jgi:hypothetical protein
MTEPIGPETIQQLPPEEERPPIKPFHRLMGVIFSPGETFADINRRPTWAFALLVAIVVSMGSAYLIRARIPDLEQRLETTMRRQIEERLEQQGAPTGEVAERQIEQALSLNRKIFKFLPLLTIVTVPLGALLIAGVFFLVLLMVQADTTFRKTFCVTSWALMATSLASNVAMAIVVLLRDPTSLDPTSPQGVLATSAGALLGLSPKTTHPLVYAIATSLDVFTIWFLILMVLGIEAISRKMSRMKAGIIAAVLWGVWVGIKVLWSALNPAG